MSAGKQFCSIKRKMYFIISEVEDNPFIRSTIPRSHQILFLLVFRWIWRKNADTTRAFTQFGVQISISDWYERWKTIQMQDHSSFYQLIGTLGLYILIGQTLRMLKMTLLPYDPVPTTNQLYRMEWREMCTWIERWRSQISPL